MIEGENLQSLDNENGGHRVQRIPPTEKRNRVHTSTITVAVINPAVSEVVFNDNDFEIQWFSGTGNGGQHRNKHMNSCRVIHLNSGLTEIRQGRKREDNKREAITALKNRLVNQNLSKDIKDKNLLIKQLQGSGERGDKIRTYRFQDDIVKDHQTNKQASVTQILQGKFELLW